jgi:murein DD-endopeptidase MepM/ murein hydrolase activator NlpD
MFAMFAIGFCLGSLATTYVSWRRTELNAGREAGVSAIEPRAAPAGDEARPDKPADPAVMTAPAIGPADTPPAPAPPAEAAASDIDTLLLKALRIPLDGVTRAELQPSFTQLRGARQHEAIDILAPRGTPVRAVEAGVVAKLFVSERGGITVYQYDPSNRFCYYYAHLDRYADGLKEGQRLREGDVVGYVGTSGNAPPDTPHLHFAIFRLDEPGRWWEGRAIDPYDVLR